MWINRFDIVPFTFSIRLRNQSHLLKLTAWLRPRAMKAQAIVASIHRLDNEFLRTRKSYSKPIIFVRLVSNHIFIVLAENKSGHWNKISSVRNCPYSFFSRRVPYIIETSRNWSIVETRSYTAENVNLYQS